MTPLEREQLLVRFALWLGADLYDARFGNDYVDVYEQVATAAAGRLPETWLGPARLRHLPTRWDDFTAVADAAARGWTTAHRSVGDRRQVAWPADGIGSRVPGLWGAVMEPLLDLNRATVGELAALPGLGPSSAARIAAHRRARGDFTTPAQLSEVKGLGRAARERAERFLGVESGGHALTLVNPVLAEQDGVLTFPALVRVLHDENLWLQDTAPPDVDAGYSAPGRARAELRRLAEQCRREPAWARDRRSDVSWLALATAAREGVATLRRRGRAPQAVAVVRNSEYLDLVLNLIERSQSRVLVQMFFLSSPGTTSPGDRLIDALVAAHARGVDTRLIIDTDLEDDYHGAARVNAESIQRLDESGLDYRLDELGTTSHSKALVVDDDQLVLGSHNWTTRAMYLLDETSLYVEGVEPAALEIERFERLWGRYHPDPDRRSIHFSLLDFPRPAELRRLARDGFEASRAFIDAHANVAAVRARARALGLEEARLVGLWRLLRLMHAFGLPETTAFALTLTPVDTPTEFRRTARERTLGYLRGLGPLPAPYAGRRLRLDVVEAVSG